ncbi:MAG: hypothetical protein ACD_2C00144G0004 [uncultured bacterium (gcode 4)]|uniref:Uncharacterized protein n=1 Tax=uncultured bacterium (gcode 4) TaxID=1234023 RepID=K2GGM4_9BACT|nr:MAG: hypothetical protein ACD_2C00144G0004 [uncultured bacterium (gcode 4)]
MLSFKNHPQKRFIYFFIYIFLSMFFSMLSSFFFFPAFRSYYTFPDKQIIPKNVADEGLITDIKPIENSSGSVNKIKIEALLKKRQARIVNEEVKSTTEISWKIIWNEIDYIKKALTATEKSKLQFKDKTWVPNIILNFKNQNVANPDYRLKYEDINHTIEKWPQKIICWPKKQTLRKRKNTRYFTLIWNNRIMRKQKSQSIDSRIMALILALPEPLTIESDSNHDSYDSNMMMIRLMRHWIS